MTDEPAPQEPMDESLNSGDTPSSTHPYSEEPEKKPSPVRGFLDILLLLILAGLAGASYMLFNMQQKQRAEINARLDQIDSQLQTLKQQSHSSKNDRAIQNLKNELSQLGASLNEQKVRQQQEVQALRQQIESQPTINTTPETPSSSAEPTDTDSHPDSEETAEPSEREPHDPEEEYVDFVESTTAKLWRLLKEGMANLIDEISRLISGA